MSTAYTSLLGLALPVTGELSGTWGDIVNNSITSLLDSAIAGTTTLSSDADVTLTTTTGAANTSREAILLWTAGGTVTRTITVPAQSKIYTVINASSSTQSIKVVGAGPTAGVTIIKGESALIAWNGSDFIKISNISGAGVFSSITNTGLTSGRVVYSTTGGLETDSANLTFNGTTLTANTLNLTNALGTAYGGTNLTSFTANGVVYASSTSALATGTALTFDGTNLSNSGNYIGTAAVGRISKSNITGRNLITGGITGGTTDGAYVIVEGYDYGGTGLGGAINLVTAGASSPITFLINGAEKMRIAGTTGGVGAVGIGYTTLTSVGDSGLAVLGNVGIGTSSPLGTLTIGKPNTTYGTVYLNGATSTPDFMRIKNTGGDVVWGVESSTAGSILTGSSAYAGVLYTVGSTSLQFGTGSGVKATIDTSGNLGLGVTPSAWFSSWNAIQGPAGKAFGVASSSNGMYVLSNAYLDATATFKYQTSDYASFYQQVNGAHNWYTAPSGTAGNAITFTQAMTLDASGNLGVGTTSPQARLTIADASNANNGTIWLGSASFYGTIKHNASGTGANEYNVATASGGGHIFQRGGTTQFMTDSSGNLLVGTTSGGGAGGLTVYPLGGGAGTAAIQVFNKTNTASDYALQFRVAGTTVSGITYTSTLVTYGTVSDYRLKTVIGPVTDSGNRIDALQPIEYTWNSNGQRTRGFLAHKFQEVYADSVTGEKDAVDADGKPIYQGMQASTSEVIADLVAEIQSLRKRLAAANI